MDDLIWKGEKKSSFRFWMNLQHYKTNIRSSALPQLYASIQHGPSDELAILGEGTCTHCTSSTWQQSQQVTWLLLGNHMYMMLLRYVPFLSLPLITCSCFLGLYASHILSVLKKLTITKKKYLHDKKKIIIMFIYCILTNHLNMSETVPLSWGASTYSLALKCDPRKSTKLEW